MPARDAKGSKTQPYYLAAPVGWQTAMEIKRRFAGSEPPIPVVGAASVDAAIGRLEDNPRCVAVLVHFAEQPQPAIELVCRIKERWRRPVICFHPAWNRDDVRRALQLGADSLLGWPFEPGEVLGDLEALHKTGVSITRKALLARGGDMLLAPDPALWIDNGDDWRGRLAGLAERLRAPSPEPEGRVTRIDPAATFNKALGGAMTPALAGATMTVMRVGTDHLPAVAGEYGVDAVQLRRTVEAGMLVPDDGRRAQVLDWLEELARPRSEDADAGVMAQLRRAAQVTLQANGELSGGVDVLANALSRATGVPVPALAPLSAPVRVELCKRVLAADDTEDALDHVRMLVLVSLLDDLGRRAPTAHDLAALTALLGLRAGVEGIRPADLVRALARLDPPAALHGLDLRRLGPVRDAIPQPGNALDQLLRRAIDELVKAAAPMGYVDQTRLVALLRAVRQGGTTLVGPTTWQTTAEVLAGRRKASDPRAVKIAQRLDRLLGVGGTDARGRLVRALEGLVERSRNPMDAGRFVAWCRDAAAGVITPEGPSERGDGALSAALSGLDAAGPQAPDFDDGPAYTGEAYAGPHPSGPQVPDWLDAPAPPVARAAGPAGPNVPDYAEGPAAAGFDPTALLDGDRVPGASPPTGSLPGDDLAPRRSRTSTGPRPIERVPSTAATEAVDALVADGDLDGAVAYAAGLPDHEPGAADALNRAALELYVADRPDEADPLWTRAAALAPDRANVLFHLARLRYEQGRITDARLLVRQVLALRPHLTPARTLRARIEQRPPRS